MNRKKYSAELTPLLIIYFCALLYSMIPFFLTGINLNGLLLSDAEFYAHSMEAMRSGLSALQAGIPMDSKPIGDQLLNKYIGLIAQYLSINLFSFSVFLSIISLLLFLTAIYFLCRETLESNSLALFISLWCIIEIHALGGTTFGFRALGFLPRDFALAISLFILYIYILALQRNSNKLLLASFFFCGIFTNYYSIAFVNLLGVLSVSEAIRQRTVSLKLISLILMWAALASPALMDLATKTSNWSSVDLRILRERNSFMIFTGFNIDSIKYIRRFFIHSVAGIISMVYIGKSKAKIEPWFYILSSSILLSITGIFIESTTEYLRLFISRASQYVTISSMILCCYASSVFLRTHFAKYSSALLYFSLSIFFLFQSSITSIFNMWQDQRTNRQNRDEFLIAAHYAAISTDKDSLFIVPSSPSQDLAASFRTYANRRIFTSYKDGGISLVDGERARIWEHKYKIQEEVFSSNSLQPLLSLMKDGGIDYIFLPKFAKIYELLNNSSKFVTHRLTENYYLVFIKKD